jgi:hypothetical protein
VCFLAGAFFPQDEPRANGDPRCRVAAQRDGPIDFEFRRMVGETGEEKTMTEKIFTDAENRLENLKQFGGCPTCHNFSGNLNVGPSHYYFCTDHKTYWKIGENLFSAWRSESTEQQKQIWDQVGMDSFTEVEPWFPNESASRSAHV